MITDVTHVACWCCCIVSFTMPSTTDLERAGRWGREKHNANCTNHQLCLGGRLAMHVHAGITHAAITACHGNAGEYHQYQDRGLHAHTYMHDGLSEAQHPNTQNTHLSICRSRMVLSTRSASYSPTGFAPMRYMSLTTSSSTRPAVTRITWFDTSWGMHRMRRTRFKSACKGKWHGQTGVLNI